MKSRSTRVRTKVVALLLSLFALWSFAAFVTVREGLNLLWVKTLDDKLGRPTETLIVALQQERRLSLVYLGGGEEAQRRALADQRIQTDEIRARFQELAQGTAYEYAAGAALEALVAEENNLFPILADVRRAVDARAATATSSAERFNELIDGGFR